MTTALAVARAVGLASALAPANGLIAAKFSCQVRLGAVLGQLWVALDGSVVIVTVYPVRRALAPAAAPWAWQSAIERRTSIQWSSRVDTTRRVGMTFRVDMTHPGRSFMLLRRV